MIGAIVNTHVASGIKAKKTRQHNERFKKVNDKKRRDHEEEMSQLSKSYRSSAMSDSFQALGSANRSPGMDDSDEQSYPSSKSSRSLNKNGLHHISKYDNTTHLAQYREVQRRTKLLYGVKDIKRMIEKSPDSLNLFKE